MESNNISTVKKIICYIALFAVSIAVVIGGAYFKKLTDMQAIRLLSCVIFAQILVIFCFNVGTAQNALYGDNINHPNRFYFFYILMLLLSLSFTAMPIASWPFVAVFALLVLMSNIPTGIIAGSICLLISNCLCSQDYYAYFMLYFLCGILAAVLFGHLDYEFKIGLPLLITEVVLLSGLFIVTSTLSAGFSIEKYVYPVTNVAITLILLFIVLKIYSSKVVFVHSDRYLEINDPECTLLSELKNRAPNEYFRSIHVAYFCDRVSRRLGLDENVLKCAGYYHRVGIIGGEISWENTYRICLESDLPNEVIDILSEFLNEKAVINKTETAVLYMSECIVSSVIYLFSKNKDIALDIQSLVDAIFKQRIETGIFKHCNISMRQLEIMKQVFIEEKLYYDFLR